MVLTCFVYAAQQDLALRRCFQAKILLCSFDDAAISLRRRVARVAASSTLPSLRAARCAPARSLACSLQGD